MWITAPLFQTQEPRLREVEPLGAHTAWKESRGVPASPGLPNHPSCLLGPLRSQGRERCFYPLGAKDDPFFLAPERSLKSP